MLHRPYEDLSYLLFLLSQQEGEGKNTNLVLSESERSLTFSGKVSMDVLNRGAGPRLGLTYPPLEVRAAAGPPANGCLVASGFYQHQNRCPRSLPPSTCHHQLADTPGSQAPASKTKKKKGGKKRGRGLPWQPCGVGLAGRTLSW